MVKEPVLNELDFVTQASKDDLVMVITFSASTVTETEVDD